jgi:hypothetical protein
MPAADPATTQPGMNTGAGGAVFSLDRHRKRGTRQTARRGTSMPTPGPQPAPEPSSHGNPLSLIAGDVELWFNRANRTLSDDETARVFAHTVDFVSYVLDGAVAQGILTPAERAELRLLLDGVRQAPKHI